MSYITVWNTFVTIHLTNIQQKIYSLANGDVLVNIAWYKVMIF